MKIKKALFISTSTEIVIRLISLTSVVFFARLLTPDELGVFIIASSVMFVASEFRMLGAHTYLVREEHIDSSKVGSAIGISILMSWGLALFLSLLSPVIASFYGNDDLVFLILLLSISFYSSPFTSTTSSLLSRELKFEKLFFLQTFGPVVGLVVSITLLYQGYSYEALAIGQAMQGLVDLLVSWFIRPSSMSWKPNLVHIRSIFRVGAYTSLINLVNRLGDVIPDLILGRLGTTAFVAIVSRAIGLQLFMRDILLKGVSKIALPYIAIQSREQGNLKEYFLKTTDMALVFVVPPIIAGSVASETLIFLLFGSQWEASVPLAEWLGIWMFIKCVHYFAEPVLLAVKAESELFWCRLAGLVGLAILLALTAEYGVTGVALSFILSASLDFVLFTFLLKKHIQLSFIDLVVKVKTSVLISLLLVSIAFVIREYLVSGLSNYLQFGIYLVLLTPTWLALVHIFNHPIKKHLNLSLK
ncbi:MAG: oligosaccharide flippase family protein [Glaciecola sp.]